jgi:hypothetical protein
LENGGWLVVGDDHDWGDGGDQPPVTEPTLEGITDHYTRAVLPTATRSPRRAAATAADGIRDSGAEYLLGYCRRYDDAHRWDHPTQAAAAGVPAALLRDQPYAGIDLGELARQLLTQEAQVTR